MVTMGRSASRGTWVDRANGGGYFFANDGHFFLNMVGTSG